MDATKALEILEDAKKLALANISRIETKEYLKRKEAAEEKIHEAIATLKEYILEE